MPAAFRQHLAAAAAIRKAGSALRSSSDYGTRGVVGAPGRSTCQPTVDDQLGSSRNHGGGIAALQMESISNGRFRYDSLLVQILFIVKQGRHCCRAQRLQQQSRSLARSLARLLSQSLYAASLFVYQVSVEITMFESVLTLTAIY